MVFQHKIQCQGIDFFFFFSLWSVFLAQDINCPLETNGINLFVFGLCISYQI